MIRQIKRLAIVLILVTFYCTSYCQPLDFQNSTYYLGPGTSLTSSGQNLSAFNFNTALSTHEIFNDGLYYPVVDYLGNNLWVRIRHIAADPNGTTVGHNVTSTQNSPFSAGGFGGWWGFLYQIDIFRDINLTGARGNVLNGIYRATVKVESIETLGLGEWVAFEITDNVNTEWVLNSKSGTPAYSAIKLPYTDPSFSTTFPIGNNNLYVIHDQNGCCAQFSISANSVSQFKFGYEYSSGGGYQGLTLTFGMPPLLPTITSFAPAFGPIGTTVTITGTNFDLTPSNNIVFFGATKATVSAASTTQLTVTVPAGATYQPISVLVGGLTAFSSKPFIVTFGDGGTIDACSFATKVDVTTGSKPYSVAIGDLDGDVKPDMAVANNESNTVSILKNISTIGSLTTSSFANKVDLITGLNPNFVAIQDLDGDGKPELIVTNSASDNISIYKNVALQGEIDSESFAARVDFTTGENPWNATIADFDWDGKPDIAIVNDVSNTISILRNTSTSGVIDATSFAPKVDFATGSFPIGIASGDLDGDGKSDLVVTNQTDNSISVFRNTSTTGSITTSSFDAKMDFAVGLEPYSVTIGDLDADGKPEVAVVNYNSGTASVLGNTSTTGTITLSAKVDFDSGVGSGTIAINDMDGDGKVDLVVANGGKRISVLKNQSTSSPITISSFSPRVDFTSTSNPYGLSIGDLDGNGKPDIAATNAVGTTASILRNTVSSLPSFTSSSFTPTSGSVGATVTINGTNFSTTPLNNTIKFNGVPAVVTASTSTTITAVVPAGATTGPLSIEIGCNTAISIVAFTVTGGGQGISFTTQPTNASVCEGTNATMTVAATGDSNLQYQWQIATDGIFINLTNDATYAGVTSPTLTITNPAISLNGSVYRCLVSGDNTSDTPSNNAPLSVFVASITMKADVLTATTGDSYQWLNFNEPIAGATNKSLEINLFEYGEYAVEVKSNGCTARSAMYPYLITGIEKPSGKFKMYPNPVKDKIIIVNDQIDNLEIIDILGISIKPLVEKHDDQHILNVSELCSGQYLLRIKSGLKTINSHFIKY